MLKESTKLRFFSKLKLNPDTGCMEWQGWRDNKGYGSLKITLGTFKAHRIAAYLAGMIDSPRGARSGLDGKNVLHACDNPSCCNPEHLFVGSHADNTADMIAKGRGYFPGRPVTTDPSNYARDSVKRRPSMCGENNHRARFSNAQVAEMKLRVAAGINTAGEIAKEYGVRHSTISNIISGRYRKP